MNMVYFRLILLCGVLSVLVSCSGGFGSDSDNASEFTNPLFQSDSSKKYVPTDELE